MQFFQIDSNISKYMFVYMPDIHNYDCDENIKNGVAVYVFRPLSANFSFLLKRFFNGNQNRPIKLLVK